MHLRKPRGLKAACVLAALAGTALMAPGAANAEPPLEHCKGVAIEGKGASLQKLAQISIWNPNFTLGTNANPLACPAGPTVKYTSTGSGPGLESWGQEKTVEPLNYGPKNAYIGSDDPSTEAQKAEIETNTGGGKVLEIPVLQESIAIIVHLPTGCTVTGGPEPGRLGLVDATVEKIFRGADTKFSQILNKAKLVGAECETKGTQHIRRVVRLEGSGTTSIFKKWMFGVFGKPVEGTETWFNLSLGAHNTVWPAESTDELTRGKGGSGVAAEVASEEHISKTEGKIGYVALADARNNENFDGAKSGGSGTNKFWAAVEHEKVLEGGVKVAKYNDPATNGDVAAKGNANCAATNYVNGKKKFPPPTVLETWVEVRSNKVEKNYSICGFTYDYSLTSFKAVKGSAEAPTEGSVRTAYDYLKWVENEEAEGGQALIGAAGTDYTGLPANVLKISQEGVEKINF
jgi:ABC-type phosphate transport system substrate-binding protein